MNITYLHEYNLHEYNLLNMVGFHYILYYLILYYLILSIKNNRVTIIRFFAGDYFRAM